MFGKLNKNLMISLVLLGFCVYIARLFAQKTITLYIHPRYIVFVVVMALVGAVVLTVGIVIQFRNHSDKPERFSFKLVDAIVILVLALAFIVPAQTLSAKTIGSKTLNVPTDDGRTLTTKANQTCPSTKPNSIEKWVNEISKYPIVCYQGQPIALTGMVFEGKDSLPQDMYYIGRVIVSCCIIDARPFALPIKRGSFPTYTNDTWLSVKGRLVTAKVNGKIRLVIEPTSVQRVANPQQPYEFINTQPTQ